MLKLFCHASILFVLVVASGVRADEPEPQTQRGVPVSYQLPADGPLPKTWRVTLAIVEAKNPGWIISQFAAGVVRTVTADNGGKFTETWNGLDDNYMPVPPGEYGVKGIYMPAAEWHVDGEWHSMTPKFVGGASSWMPPAKDWQTPMPFNGDPVDSPMGDVAVGPNGVAVFYYRYLENGKNNPMFDLHRPVGYNQFLRAFISGGAGGGNATATDGETVWSYSDEGGPKYVYRADQKPFGSSYGAHRTNCYLPAGKVTSLAAWTHAGKPYLAVAQRGKMVPRQDARHVSYQEDPNEPVNKITLHDGENGKILGELPSTAPQSLTVKNGVLYALHKQGMGWGVSAVRVEAGTASGEWKQVCLVPSEITPADMEVDSRGRIYLSDEQANHVFQLDAAGKVLLKFGRLAAQQPGTYDPHTFMAPGKLATWVDADGKDRLLVVENAGPNRVSEWSADGKLLREFQSLQTKANNGWAIDPQRSEHAYVPGHQGWLTRFLVDYESGKWTVDAVWPLRDDPRARDLRKPRVIHAQGRVYLVGTAGSRQNAFTVYRLDKAGWKLSAAILRIEKDAKTRTMDHFLWHDANDNGRVDDEELTATQPPVGTFTYHGQNWSADFAFLAVSMGTPDVWRLAPSGFDAHGNPIFKEWTKLLTDPIFTARANKTADAVHGGNELDEKFSSDWCQADGSLSEGYYVQARGGKSFSANEGPQHKISRYVPDGAGGFRLMWRTGRTTLKGVAKPEEVYGAMRVHKAVNGLLSVVDQSRCGILLYTEDGLYVDTLFPDGRVSKQPMGMYPQPGEFFAGSIYPNQTNGKIYLGMGKYTPVLFEVEGWSLRENPVRPLTTVQRTVNISAAQIASPPEIALTLRGGAGSAKFARFSPAIGGAVLDGSLSGWESCEPVKFSATKEQAVEVRCLYDPEHLYLRWHTRLAAKFEAKPLPPLERIFTHDQGADTLSFYVQSDVNAKPASKPEGRPGDVRVVFGVFQKGDKVEPVAVGMYPHWEKAGASPQVYRTPVGSASFAHVGPIEGAKLFQRLDEDGKGFVVVSALPRAAFPQMKEPFAGGLRTLANFEATLGGHNKFWWADSDGSASRETYDEPTEARLYPGSWAPIEFTGLGEGVIVRNWLVCGPFGGPGAEQFNWDPNGKMPNSTKDKKVAVRELLEAAKYPPEDGRVDLTARYTGEIIKGWWNDPRVVTWKPAKVADLDTRLAVGQAAAVWFGSTWVHVPEATELKFQFQTHPQTYLRWSLNNELVPIKDTAYKDAAFPGGPLRLRTHEQTLTLKQGWNQVGFRGYCTGYSHVYAGLTFQGDADKLWTLKLAALPPEASSTSGPLPAK
ncbi:hypothetical protein ETAA8_01560 [Anatilimnocola aggregata]|uniref:Uncharacterized protein n=1 Tax=Anatilimnocola aggregata TaxID=2528021 RepID=A0A517Y4E2_9BACT|nr:hypothetical protein [Anatilimnocola aggregata]QDU25095.1 hypothetical protein ETAA8_01560 [Anatilimnocola aggregata]